MGDCAGGVAEPRWARLAVEPAAIDDEDVAVDVVGGAGGEEDGGAGDVFGLAPAGGGNALEDLAGTLGIIAQGLSVVGIHIAGGDGVDVDALGSPLIGEGFGELADAAFGCGVRRHGDSALKGEEGGDVDDLTGPAGEHVTACVLGEAEDTGEIDVDEGLPVFFGVVDGRRAANGAGVVDKDVNGAEVLDGVFHEARTDFGFADVADEAKVIGADLLEGFFCSLGGAAGAVHNYVGAGFSERECNACAEAARGSRNQGSFAFEMELVENQGNGSFPAAEDLRSTLRLYLY